MYLYVYDCILCENNNLNSALLVYLNLLVIYC